MSTCVGRIGNNGVAPTQITKRKCGVGSITTNGTHIGLPGTKQVHDLLSSHALDLVDIPRSLVVAIDLIAFIRMPFGVATHEVGVLYVAHRFAGSILAGDEVDGLCLPPGILLCYNVLDIADVYCHVFHSLVILLC